MKTPKTKNQRNAKVNIRTTEEIKEKAVMAAEAERRTLSQWVEGLILDAFGKRKNKQ